MAFSIRTRESIFVFLLITSFVLHKVTSQNLEAANSQLGEVRNNDEAKTVATINEQQGKPHLNF